MQCMPYSMQRIPCREVAVVVVVVELNDLVVVAVVELMVLVVVGVVELMVLVVVVVVVVMGRML